MKPVLRWAGGKRWLVPTMEEILRAWQPKRYFEPFAGGAALALAFSWPEMTVADANPDLIATYRGIVEDPDLVKRKLARMRVTKTDYDRIRRSRPRSDTSKAARLLYLNRSGYGGIYRTDRQGVYNVPFSGDRSTARLCRTNVIDDAATALKRARLLCGDFEDTLRAAGAGSLVYCDPAYALPEGDRPFRRYSSPTFTWADQLRLAARAEELRRLGALVLVSNYDDPRVEQLYSRALVISFKRRLPLPRAEGATIVEPLFVLGPRGVVDRLRRALSEIPR